LLALMLAVWALWILDPVSRLGDQFYLGELFRYAGPGFWFGLPTGSQIGFAATAAVLLAVLFRMDRAAPDLAVDHWWQHPHLPALITYHGQVFHLAGVAFWIGADTIGGSAVLMWVPAACITAVYWSRLRLTTPGRSDRDASTPPPVVAGERRAVERDHRHRRDRCRQIDDRPQLVARRRRQRRQRRPVAERVRRQQQVLH